MESSLMRFAGFLRLRALRWSMRRLHCPVDRAALVLEVGAGGNPYPRANVLLDAMEESVERNEQALITDRPLVLGLCENLPFRDKSFDFVIASHVLEHTEDPEKFISELVRVSKAGYIETPEGWFEKMCAFTYHRLEVSNVKGKLFIRKKENWKPEEIAKLWDNKLANSEALSKFLISNPDLNHMRYFWQDNIDFEIVNPQCDAGWKLPDEVTKRPKVEASLKSKLRDAYLNSRRWLFSQNTRNRKIELSNILRCVECHSEELNFDEGLIVCTSCDRQFEVKDDVPKMFPENLEKFEKAHSIDS